MADAKASLARHSQRLPSGQVRASANAASPLSPAERNHTGLTAEERERGWVEYHCDGHGFLVATTPRGSVYCACGKRARRLRNGRLVDPETLKPTQAKARELNAAGHPFIHACGDCGQDFGGGTLLKRHRTGSKLKKHCLSAKQMQAKGWFVDGRGRWRQRGKFSPPHVDKKTGPNHASAGLRELPEVDGQVNAGSAPEPRLALPVDNEARRLG